MQPGHIDWLSKTDSTIETSDGVAIEVWKLNHQKNDTVLSSWAKHFRQHYCADADLPALISGTGKTKAEFLLSTKFPDAKKDLGPATRSGDFAEILVADYIEYVLGYWCPREHRYEGRINANVSDNGTDIVGFKFLKDKPSAKDELILLETKAGLRPSKGNRLQDAIDGSEKDALREAMTLSAIKQRLLRKDQKAANRIERFQNEADHPFVRLSGAATVVDEVAIEAIKLTDCDASKHRNKKNLRLIVIVGTSMMDLVHLLYERAANEA